MMSNQHGIEGLKVTINVLEVVVNSEELVEIARKEIEDALIGYRDNRISAMGRNNGLVIKEKDGTESNIIRFGPESAITIGLCGVMAYLSKILRELEAANESSK